MNVARMEEGTGALKKLTANSKGNIPIGRPRCRLEDNARMDFKEIRGIGWIQLSIGVIGEPL